MTDRWIMHVPVLNTCHITKEENDFLNGVGSPAIDMGDSGYMIYCGELSDELPDGCHYNDTDDYPGINACMRWARHNGSSGWLRFAESGDDVDELPQYEW